MLSPERAFHAQPTQCPFLFNEVCAIKLHCSTDSVCSHLQHVVFAYQHQHASTERNNLRRYEQLKGVDK
jgi:hypothetical protein